MKTNERFVAERRERDHAFMTNPDRWPRWPFLPIKRIRNSSLECALLVDGQGTKVFHANLVDPNLKKSTEYADLEAILDDGWRVD